MYIQINPDSQQKCLSQGRFLAQSHPEKYRIILLFTIAYLNSRLVLPSLFSTISIILNVIRATLLSLSITLKLKRSNTSILWKQEKVHS